MLDKYYFGSSKNIKDESENNYLEANKYKFNSLMFLVSSYVRKNPQTELSNRYTSKISYYVEKFKKAKSNTIDSWALQELIEFFSYLLEIETPN